MPYHKLHWITCDGGSKGGESCKSRASGERTFQSKYDAQIDAIFSGWTVTRNTALCPECAKKGKAATVQP